MANGPTASGKASKKSSKSKARKKKTSQSKKCVANHCTTGAGFYTAPMRVRPDERGFNQSSSKTYDKPCSCKVKQKVSASYRCPPGTATSRSAGDIPVCSGSAKPYKTKGYSRCQPKKSSRCGKRK